MLQSDSPIPLYEQIKDYILRRIESGEFPPNTKLPSERDLAAQFQVSRLTVNKAIKELVQAGWLQTQIGKGTYINDQPIQQEITALTSFTEEMSLRGQTTTSNVLRAEITKPTDDTARALKISPLADVVVLERVRFVSSNPIAIENSSLIAAKCTNILDNHDFRTESLYHVLQTQYGIQLTHADQSFEARPATQTEAQQLSIETGAPVLEIQRVTYTQDEQPFEVVNSVYRGDRYKFRARLKRL